MVLAKFKLAKRRLFNFIAKQSQYKFLTQYWTQINDVKILEKLFSSEFYTKQIVPIEPNLSFYKKILVLSPHQDDESIGCGGLLKKLSDLGSNLHVLYTTDGAQNNLGVSTKDSVLLRNKEAEKALSFVGATYDQLDINNINPVLSESDIQLFSDKLNQFKPDLILIPWLFDFPVKHRLTNHMVYLARKSLRSLRNVEVWSYQVHNHLYPNIAIDISNEIHTKTSMIKQFESQNTNFKDYTHLTVGLNAYNSKYLKGSRYCELFFGLPLKEYINYIDTYYSGNENFIYRGDKQYINNISELEAQINTK